MLDREEIRRLFPEAERSAQRIAQLIGHGLPEGYGFALLVFSFGEKGYLTWVSNAERADMIATLREAITMLDGKKDSPPGVVGQKD